MSATPPSYPAQRFQYAFVMDSDTNPAYNYVPAASFPNDFFAGTDRWYDLTYAPATGWQLACKQVGAGNAVTTVASGARAILRGDTLLLLVPQSEFAATRRLRSPRACTAGNDALWPNTVATPPPTVLGGGP